MKAYNDIFTQELSKLGYTQGVQHVINTDGAIPIKQRPYRATIPDQEFIAEEIQKMLQAGIIRPSMSPWTSSIVVVSKKNGKKWLCIDYRKLNSVTQKDVYSLLRIDEMLDSLENSKWFSSLDLSSGY